MITLLYGAFLCYVTALSSAIAANLPQSQGLSAPNVSLAIGSLTTDSTPTDLAVSKAEYKDWWGFSKHFPGVQVPKGSWRPTGERPHQFTFPYWVKCSFARTDLVGTTQMRWFYKAELENSILSARYQGPDKDGYKIMHRKSLSLHKLAARAEFHVVDFTSQAMLDDNLHKSVYIRFKVNDEKIVPNPSSPGGTRTEPVQDIIFMWVSVIDSSFYHRIGHPNEADFKAHPCERGPWAPMDRTWKNGAKRGDHQ